MNHIYEITAAGFDGSTDETDDHVLWLIADSEQQVRDAIKDTVATMQQMRKQGLKPDFINAVLRLTAGARVQAPKEPTLQD